MKLKDHQIIYVRSMGKALKVTAIFTDDDSANSYMSTHSDEGVIAEYGGVIFIANLYDPGTSITAISRQPIISHQQRGMQE